MVEFLCDLISIPSTPTNEERVIRRIEHEMDKVGFKRAWIDRAGNIMGQIGIPGGTKLLYKAHVDTVGVGHRMDWRRDPYEPYNDGELIMGRGAVDSKQAIAAMIYGAKAIIDRGILLDGELFIAGTVQEEECEGMGIRALLEQAALVPDYVVLGEPTTLRIFRGHRGHAEISIIVSDQNAPQMTAQMVLALGELNETLAEDTILGKGSITVKRIETEYNPCVDVPIRCRILVDRRLTQDETEADAIKDVRTAIEKLGLEAQVEIAEYREPSWRGYTPCIRQCTPSYLLDETHDLVRIASDAIEDALGWEPDVTRRKVDLDSVGTAGLSHLPVIAFGPGDEAFAHTMQEHVYIQDMVDAANAYAQMAVQLIGLAK